MNIFWESVYTISNPKMTFPQSRLRIACKRYNKYFILPQLKSCLRAAFLIFLCWTGQDWGFARRDAGRREDAVHFKLQIH